MVMYMVCKIDTIGCKVIVMSGCMKFEHVETMQLAKSCFMHSSAMSVMLQCHVATYAAVFHSCDEPSNARVMRCRCHGDT